MTLHEELLDLQPGNTSAIFALSLNGGEPYAVTPEERERPIDKFEFSPDGDTIAFLSADEKSEEERAKEKSKDDAIVWGEKWENHRLRLVNVKARTVNTLVDLDEHVIDFSWSESGSTMAFATVKSPELESCDVYGTAFYTVDIASGHCTKLCTFPTYIGNLVYSNEHIYFIGQASEHCLVSAKMVYKISADLEPTEYHKHAHGVEDCAMRLEKRGGSVIVEVQHGMENQLRVLKGATIFSEKNMVYCWDVKGTEEPGRAVVAVAFSSTEKPAEVYVTHDVVSEYTQISKHSQSLAGRDFGSSIFVSCPSSDNKVTLDGMWQSPPSSFCTGNPLPTIVVIHGGPYGRSTDAIDNTYFGWGPSALAAGFAILAPNYRGGSSRGDTFAAYARGAGKEECEDVIALTQHVIEKGYADKHRLVAAGWSNGGTIANRLSVRNGLYGHGWKFQATISGSGVSDNDSSIFSSDMGIWKAAIAGKQPWQCDKDDMTNRKGSAIWEFHSALQRGGVIPPMLIMHPERDARVGIEQAWGMKRALESAGLPFEFVIYPREGHMILERGHLLDMGKRVLRFAQQYIGDM